jgi:hypothetical protein
MTFDLNSGHIDSFVADPLSSAVSRQSRGVFRSLCPIIRVSGAEKMENEPKTCIPAWTNTGGCQTRA